MNSHKQRITILGSTGSVGTSTLDVIARHPERFEVFALSASTKVDELLAQCLRFAPSFAVMASAVHARQLESRLREHDSKTRVLGGPEALETIASHEEVDAVMAAIVGAAGLAPCLAAARTGKRLMLANKEALVVGGELFMRSVREGGATLLPIDSEHSAIFQSLPEDPATWPRRIDKIILTASGGPFRTRAPGTLGAGLARRGLRPSELGHGPQDLGRLGDHDEQGARSDRGPLPVRRHARADRGGDSSAERGAFDGAVHRRLGHRPARHARHARADRGRPGLAGAHRERCVQRSTSAGWAR